MSNTHENTGKKPEKKFRAGAISAAVWLNEGQTKDGKLAQYRTVSLQRGYKDKNDEWQSTNSFRVNDLPKAVLVLNEAYRYIMLKEPEISHNDSIMEEEIII